ncbi:MFS transporter [Streptomyces sp. SCL15-4]|uniref:MFS transporter n=1 Tax=Streptomyces sp. SCL15-4 TaxID=2967221 RepID=UPI0029661DFA|nr:MFS transporter [Streptomyces sp. SCL15-4]
MNKPSVAPSPPTAPTPEQQFLRLRIALTLFFALGGFLFAGWAIRIPAIKEQTHASPASLGLALFCMTAAAVVSMLVTGRLCRRFGSRRMTIATAALLSATVFLSPLTHSAPTLGLVLIVFGAAYGGIDVAGNSVAVELIQATDRPLMPGFHAANSLGSLAGAGLGGLLATSLTPTRHLLLLVPVGLAATALGGRVLLSTPTPARRAAGAAPATDRQDRPDTAGRRSARVRPDVLVFGVLGLCAAYSQGALDTWVPLHISDDLDGGPGAAAAGYATVTLMLALGRLLGTRLLERLGQTAVVTAGGLAAGAAMVVAALSTQPWLVFAALAVTGLGLANIFPVAMARAGAAGGPDGVALASTLGYSGILVAPPSIGFLAQGLGLPVALNAIAVMIVASGVIAYAARNRGVPAARGTARTPVEENNPA